MKWFCEAKVISNSRLFVNTDAKLAIKCMAPAPAPLLTLK